MPADDGPDEWQRIAVQVDLERREGEPGDSGRKVDIVQPVRADRAGGAADRHGVRCRDRASSRCRSHVDQTGVPVARQGQLLPELGGQRRDGPVSHRTEPDGGRPDRQRRRADLRKRAVPTTCSRCSPWPASALCIFWRVRGDVRHAADVPVFGPPTGPASMRAPRSRGPVRRVRSRPVGPASLRTARHRRGGSVDPSARGAATDRDRAGCDR